MLYTAEGGGKLKNDGTKDVRSTVRAGWNEYIDPETGKIDSYISGSHHVLKTKTEFAPEGTEIKSIKASKKALTVKWRKAAYSNGYDASVFDAEGYQLKISTNKSFTNPRYITAYSTKKTIKKLKAKKKYYVQVRAWNYDEGGEYKIYSKWSSIKAKKTK